MNDDGWPHSTAEGIEPWFGRFGRSEPGTGSELAAAYARCFATPDGQRVLEHLCHRTLGRACGPEASEALLRHVEGQRHLVAGIKALIQRGGR